MAQGDNMRWVRKTAMIALVWATASSMVFAATPYYVCRCPDGTITMHGASSGSAESSCCSSPCCAPEAKEKPCCQASKKKWAAKSSCCIRGADLLRSTTNLDGSPTIGQTHCQKTLIQPEQRSFCRLEVKPLEGANEAVVALARVAGMNSSIATNAETTFWRIDKIPPPTDLVTVFQRFTI